MTSLGNRWRRWRWFLAFVALAVASAWAWWYATYPWPDEARTFSVSTGHLEVVHLRTENRETATVPVDCFFPSDHQGEALPAVIMLPGADGMAFQPRSYHSIARHLADEGFAVFVLRYFDPFTYEHLIQHDESGKFDTQYIREHIPADRPIWIDTCNAAVAWVAHQPEVTGTAHDEDEPRIALVGYSLGGFVALASADELNNAELPHVNAVVVNFGARFEDMRLSSKMPPVWFYHGQADDIVPLVLAQQTMQELIASGVTAGMTTYLGQGHPLTGDAAENCRDGTCVFLAKQMAAEHN